MFPGITSAIKKIRLVTVTLLKQKSSLVRRIVCLYKSIEIVFAILETFDILGITL